ncbi:MAG: hypothetical protein GF320_09090 [Armatimonadia bacterium]|nr:hypothetical protein [Armatimonadia bacterium]
MLQGIRQKLIRGLSVAAVGAAMLGIVLIGCGGDGGSNAEPAAGEDIVDDIPDERPDEG